MNALIPVFKDRPATVTRDGVTTFISVHDAEFLREYRERRDRMLAVHPDRLRHIRPSRKVNGYQFDQLRQQLFSWYLKERTWYREFDLKPPVIITTMEAREARKELSLPGDTPIEPLSARDAWIRFEQERKLHEYWRRKSAERGKMMRKISLMVLCLLLPIAAAAQTTPCDTSTATTIYNPTLAHVPLTDFTATLPDSTTPLYDTVVIGFFLPGVTPNAENFVSSTTVPRGSLKNSGGSCYTATLGAVPTAARTIAFRKVRTAPEPDVSPWGATSGPFASLAALTPPGAARVSK
jgi:hypothetical protein